MNTTLITTLLISAITPLGAIAEMNLFEPTLLHYAKASTVHAAPADDEVRAVPFYEGFEGWDGITFDWLPDGWTEVSKSDPPHTRPNEDWTLNFTWQTEGASWGDTAPEGSYMARIGNAFYSDSTKSGQTVFEYQDEWLISPKIALTEHNKLYFMLGLHPGWLFINPSTAKFDRVNNIMEVHISDDGSETWAKLWDCIEDGMNFSNDELWTSLSSLKSDWVKGRIDLSDYDGKTVQIAFRYVGVEGESMLLDAIAVRQPAPIAQYMAPSGIFYSGYATDYSTLDKSSMLYGTEKNAEWTNVSNIDCEEFVWAYVNSNGKLEREETENFEFYCRPGTMSIPILTASAPYAESVSFRLPFEQVQCGGEFANGVGACNYDLSRSVGSYKSDDTYIFGNDGRNFWEKAVSATGYKVNLEAYCNYFPAPNHSYSISKVWINAWADMTDDAELTIDLLSVTSTGGVSQDPIASAVCKGRDVIYHTDSDGTVYATLPFDLGERITIDGGLIVRIYGFDGGAGINSLQILHQYQPNSDGANYAYVQLTASNDSEAISQLVSVAGITTQYGAMSTALCVNMDVNFSRLECSDRALNAGSEATAKGFRFSTDYAGDDVKISGDGVGDWISYNVKPLDESTSIRIITLAVNDNLGGARSSVVTVEIPGSKATINVTQTQAASIEEIAPKKLPTAGFCGNQLIVHNADGMTLRVWNSNGTQMTDTRIAGNTMAINAERWAAGLYIIQLNNVSQKLIKQ